MLIVGQYQAALDSTAHIVPLFSNNVTEWPALDPAPQ
jgi:hypothetical protein